MYQQYQNIYQVSREDAKLTQEKAAELLNISVESLRAYESSRRIPNNQIVSKMIKTYDNPLLGYQHIQTNTEAGVMFLPRIEMKSLSTATLILHKEMEDYLKCEEKFIEIVCDDIITEDEEEMWAKGIKELDDIFGAILTLKFAKKNKEGY